MIVLEALAVAWAWLKVSGTLLGAAWLASVGVRELRKTE